MNHQVINHNRLMLTIVSVVIILSCAPHPTAAQRQRICGSSLRQALQLLCSEYPSYHHKRTTGYENDATLHETAMAKDWPQLDQNDIDRINFIEQLKRKPNWMNLLFAKHRVPVDGTIDDYVDWENVIPNRFSMAKRGIVDECCYQPCSIEQMKAYCSKVATNETKNN